MNKPPSTATVRWLMAAAGLLVLSGGASAQTSPYYLGLSQTFTHNSNLFIRPSGSETSEKISSTGLRAGVDQTLGRQQLLVDAAVNANRYSSNSQLNNTGYSLNGRLNWETVERLSGTLSANTQQSLFLYNLTGAPYTSRVLRRSQGVDLQARLGGVTEWSFEAGMSANRERFSDVNLSNRNLNRQAVNGGVRWRPTGNLSLFLGGRHATADYPNFSALGSDEVKRDDIDLSSTLEASGASTVSARLSRSRTTHSQLALRNGNGWTGALNWGWRPTGKLTVDYGVSRDNNFGQTTNTLVDNSDTVIGTFYSARAAWEATGKINVTGGLTFGRRTVDNTFSIGGTSLTPTRSGDKTTTVSLGLTYQPLRNVDLGCSFNWNDRQPNAGATVTYAYSVRIISCFGQVYLR
ncbi:MAG: hypothetical protein ABI574_11270 [Burkholderiales bacterium]